jgi:hypothetical protein
VTDPLMLDFTGPRMAGEAGRSGQASHLSYLESEYAAYCADRDELPAWNCGPFVLPLSPDALHKANISGGPAYGVQIPDACADAVFRYCDGVLMPFIGYLNLAFRFGGFPGFWHGQNAEEKYSARRIGDGLLGL